MSAQILTQSRLKKLLHYCPETGLFTWRSDRDNAGNAKKGNVAGWIDSGYRKISIANSNIKAHRLAFLYMNGCFPENQVDHKDRNKLNNKWCNLRNADHSVNSRNHPQRHDNTSGVTGVSWCETHNRWIMQISSKNKRMKKTFTSFYKAVAVRKAMEVFLDYNENHGGS